jgi:uncharacterized membrane protein
MRFVFAFSITVEILSIKMMNNKNPLMSKDRLEMFSDGVFAIAITLLVLEIKIPTHEKLEEYHGLYGYLMHIWPSFLGYVVGFLCIGIYWSNHHHLFLYIVKKTDHKFNMINIVFLMSIALMPFSVAIVSDFATDPHNRSAAVLTYCVSLILPQITLIILFLYGKKTPGIFSPLLKPGFMNKQLMKLSLATGLSLVAIVLSMFFPLSTLALIGVMFMMYFLPPDNPEFLTDDAQA